MRFLFTSIRKDVDTVRRDPFGLLIPIGIPLVLAILMNMVFGRTGSPIPHGTLLVADEDRSFGSTLVIGAFARKPVADMVSVRQVSRAEGRALIDRGKASAFLIIPQGLQNAVVQGRSSQLQLITNPAERIIPGMIEETLSIALETAFYIQKLGGQQLQRLQTPLIQFEATEISPRTTVNFAALFFPSMIFMSLMMVANSLASEIWKERTAGTLRRLAATPIPLAAYLAGRLLFVAFVLACIGAAGVLTVHWMAGVPVSSFPAAVIWVMFSGCTLYLCLLFLVMGAQSPRTANVMGNMVVFPLAMLGGCFFPFEIMPNWMASVGRLTPNGWAVVHFRDILGGSATAASLAGPAAALIAVSAIAFVLSARRLRRGFLL